MIYTTARKPPRPHIQRNEVSVFQHFTTQFAHSRVARSAETVSGNVPSRGCDDQMTANIITFRWKSYIVSHVLSRTGGRTQHSKKYPARWKLLLCWLMPPTPAVSAVYFFLSSVIFLSIWLGLDEMRRKPPTSRYQQTHTHTNARLTFYSSRWINDAKCVAATTTRAEHNLGG